MNLTVEAKNLSNHSQVYKSRNFTIYQRYSPFRVSYPTGVNDYSLFPSTYNSKEVEPYGKTEINPIFNITSQALTDDVDVTVCVNDTFDSCLAIVWSENYNQSNSSDITTTSGCTSRLEIVTSMNSTEWTGIYNWWNLTDCTTDAFKYL